MNEEELLQKIAEAEQETGMTHRVLKASKSGAALLDLNYPEDRKWLEEDDKENPYE